MGVEYVGYGMGCGAVKAGREFWNGLGFEYLTLLLLTIHVFIQLYN
jgi:hypothetical protein